MFDYNLLKLDSDVWIDPEQIAAIVPLNSQPGWSRIVMSSGKAIGVEMTPQEILETIQERIRNIESDLEAEREKTRVSRAKRSASVEMILDNAPILPETVS